MRTLTFVIPVLNEAAAIMTRLDALRIYRDRGHEVVVVDGGSEDATLAHARAGADQVLVSKPGRARQMNLGASVANGEVLVFLHVDTTLPADADVLIIRTLEGEQGGGLANPGAKSGPQAGDDKGEVQGNARRQAAATTAPLPGGLVRGRPRWGWFDARLDNPGLAYRVIGAAMNLRARLTRVCTGDQTLFMERQLFEQVGGFPDIPLMEDVAMAKTLRHLATPGVVRCPVLTSSRRWQNHGLLPTVLLMWKLRFLYYCGVDPEKLRRQYYPQQNPPPQNPPQHNRPQQKQSPQKPSDPNTPERRP